MKKIGIITFHNSYNCGSMLESYAIQKKISDIKKNKVEIINFSNDGQHEVYAEWYKNNSLKNIIKNILIFPARKRIKNNNHMYEKFKNEYFNLTKSYSSINELSDEEYDYVVSGSDQIWNITIEDGDDAYFLPWVKKAKKIAYAPSFGAKRIKDFTDDYKKYCDYINDYDFLSVRESNGQKWIKEMTGKKVPILLDPTLLLKREDYDKLVDNNISTPKKYIFFYSPGFDKKICEYVKKISEKYNLKVITWSTKSYYIKRVKRFGFELAEYENPSSYLYYIKNAELVLTTSFHGTIFSTIYNKKFITIKNGGMYGDDDRVITLLNQLEMMDRLIPHIFDENFDYMKDIDYSKYNENVNKLSKISEDYLRKSLQ